MSTRLLIVDDQPNARELIRSFLKVPGITFQECASGEDAIACVREFKPHWVTMDVRLPGLNGFETTKAIKKAHPETRVMIVTSFNDPHFRNLANSSGAAGFILKENLLALRLMLEKETRSMAPLLSASDSHAQPGRLKPKRILVLDDDKEMLTMFALLPAGEGYRVTQAYSGPEAIARHRQNPFDLVVVELLLPGNEGFETLIELRRSALPPKIIATAKPGWMKVEVYTKMAKQLGVHATLAKPFAPEELLATVRAVLTS